ncbi:MAG: outer membrane protein TolC [Salibacteraceae bacterium]|jgi:outer membrane protein TolC
MKKYLFVIFLVPGFVQAQVSLGFTDFIQLVKVWHPVAIQSQLISKQGEAGLIGAKGTNDPKLIAENTQKNFGGKDYYNLQKYGLKIPTRSGVSFQGGYEKSEGDFLNPMDYTPNEGLYYAGVEIQLGNGLFTDKRRAAIQQAELFSSKTKQQQLIILNNLMLEAGQVYWDWLESKNNLDVFKNALAVADQRYKAVRQNVSFGERPSNDTLEAKIQFQTRKVQYQQSVLHYANTKALVQVYLWQDGIIPLQLDESVSPTALIDPLAAQSIPENYLANHPELDIKKIEIQSSNVDLKLKREEFKPELNLKYDVLSSSFSNETEVDVLNNYRLGVQFSMPLFLRKARGETKLYKYKISQKELQLQYKQAEIIYKVSMAENELQAYQEIIIVQNQSVSDYQSLLNGERTLFNLGESSLFMVNSREMKFIQSQLKLNEILKKRNKSKLKIQHAQGVLYKI